MSLLFVLFLFCLLVEYDKKREIFLQHYLLTHLIKLLMLAFMQIVSKEFLDFLFPLYFFPRVSFSGSRFSALCLAFSISDFLFSTFCLCCFIITETLLSSLIPLYYLNPFKNEAFTVLGGFVCECILSAAQLY